MMRRLYQRWVLWRAYYCTKHLVPKHRTVFGGSYCRPCFEEDCAGRTAYLESILKEWRK